MINNWGKDLNNVLFEAVPIIDLYKSWTLRDLLQPGLPTINKGILELTHTNKVNKLFNNALFFAIPFPFLYYQQYIFALYLEYFQNQNHHNY